MATGWGATAGNAALDAEVTARPWIVLHTGDPGANLTANLATETTRKQVTFGSASGGVVSNSAQIQWTNVAASEDYTHFSTRSASSGGSVGVSGTITANAVTAGDTFTIAVGDLDISVTLAS